MRSDAPKVKTSVEPSPIRRSEVIAASGGDDAFRSTLAGAHLVLLPGRSGHATSEPERVFAPNASELFDYLREHAEAGIRVELASTDDDYLELGLHGAELWLAPILIEPTLVTIAVNMLSNYLTDWTKAGLDRVSARVHSEIHVTTPDAAVAFKYEGPPGPYEKTMRSLIENALPGGHRKGSSEEER